LSRSKKIVLTMADGMGFIYSETAFRKEKN